MRKFIATVKAGTFGFNFPADMLRYDNAQLISDADGVAKVSYETKSRNLPSVTFDRWKSFGWTVTKVVEVKDGDVETEIPLDRLARR